jgi:hypothetical protein
MAAKPQVIAPLALQRNMPGPKFAQNHQMAA